MGTSRLIWQAQSRDDLVIHTIVDQLTRTAASKQILMKHYFRTKNWGEAYFDEFLSHLTTLYDLSQPITNMKDNYDKSEFVFDEAISSDKRVRPALELYKNIIIGLKVSGIWSVRKDAGFNRKTKFEHSVRGV